MTSPRRAAVPLVLLSLAGLAASSPAAAQIFQPGTQPIGEPGGITDLIASSRSCRNCHGNYSATAEETYEPYDSWRGSLMASAMRDPVARAAIAIAEEDVEGAADFCLRCHTPSAWLRGRSELPEYDAANPEHPERLADDVVAAKSGLSNDLDGVGCMVCHRMIEPPMPSMISNAQLVLADGLEAAIRRGPYEYPPGEEPRHETAVEPFLSDARLCGSCHDIHNPLHDGFRGETPTGRRFAIERTFSEWANSAFADEGRTCQDCHMPEVDQHAAADRAPLPTRPEMSRHDLNGGNVWVPRAIAAMVRELDPTAATLLEASSDRARTMLEAAATLEIRESALDAGTATATATIRVTNETGHKLPTGYPEGRLMWIELEVLDATGRVVAGSGRYDDETDEVEHDAQLRTYEVRMGVGGAHGFHFALQDTLIEDTRIPPRGFRAPLEADIAPLGREYLDGDDAYVHHDETTYTLRDLCGEGELTLRARLRYLTTTREYIEFLRDEAPDSSDPELAGRSWGDVAYDAWREHGGDVPIDMETVEVALGPSPGACAPPDAGPPDGGPVDSGPMTSVDAGREGGSVLDAGTSGGGGGCGCRAGSGRARSPIALLLAALASLALRVRRRSARGVSQRFAALIRSTNRANK
jgi:MYXO-CTERM domain-containing protein